MIAVLGLPMAGAGPDGARVPAGLAASVALAAAAAGAQVELVGRIGDDPIGEAVLIALGRAGVGHRAMLRDTRPTPGIWTLGGPAGADEDGDGDDGTTIAEQVLDVGDIAMGLRYVPDFRVLVAAAAVDQAGAAAIAEAAGYAGASLIAVAAPGGDIEPAIPGAIVLEAPASDPDGAFAGLVARLAVALDQGRDPATAFAAAVAAGGWDRIGDD